MEIQLYTIHNVALNSSTFISIRKLKTSIKNSVPQFTSCTLLRLFTIYNRVQTLIKWHIIQRKYFTSITAEL